MRRLSKAQATCLRAALSSGRLLVRRYGTSYILGGSDSLQTFELNTCLSLVRLGYLRETRTLSGRAFEVKI